MAVAAAPTAPLEVLQGILLDVGARLALNQAVSGARAAAAQGSGRWAGLIRLERATVRPVGVRCAQAPVSADGTLYALPSWPAQLVAAVEQTQHQLCLVYGWVVARRLLCMVSALTSMKVEREGEHLRCACLTGKAWLSCSCNMVR